MNFYMGRAHASIKCSSLLKVRIVGNKRNFLTISYLCCTLNVTCSVCGHVCHLNCAFVHAVVTLHLHCQQQQLSFRRRRIADRIQDTAVRDVLTEQQQGSQCCELQEDRYCGSRESLQRTCVKDRLRMCSDVLLEVEVYCRVKKKTFFWNRRKPQSCKISATCSCTAWLLHSGLWNFLTRTLLRNKHRPFICIPINYGSAPMTQVSKFHSHPDKFNTPPNQVLRYPDWFLNSIKVIRVIENICRTLRYSTWCTRKCNSSSVLKKYSVFCRLCRFITVFARDCHWARFWSK